MSVSILVALALAFVWCVVVGEFSIRQMLAGFAFGVIYVVASGTGRGILVPARELPRRMMFLTFHVLVLLPYDVVRASIRLAVRILARKPRLRPGIVRIPLGEEVSRATIALEEHAITLTPGQVLIDYSADENTAYIHLVDVDELQSLKEGVWRWYRTVLDKVFA